jgi:hypothetical protein
MWRRVRGTRVGGAGVSGGSEWKCCASFYAGAGKVGVYYFAVLFEVGLDRDCTRPKLSATCLGFGGRFMGEVLLCGK